VLDRTARSKLRLKGSDGIGEGDFAQGAVVRVLGVAVVRNADVVQARKVERHLGVLEKRRSAVAQRYVAVGHCVVAVVAGMRVAAVVMHGSQDCVGCGLLVAARSW
jgi:hypothetical protein